MDLNELPLDLQTRLRELKYASATVQNDVLQAFEDGENARECASKAIDAMTGLISEATTVIQWCSLLIKEENSNDRN